MGGYDVFEISLEFAEPVYGHRSLDVAFAGEVPIRRGLGDADFSRNGAQREVLPGLDHFDACHDQCCAQVAVMVRGSFGC